MSLSVLKIQCLSQKRPWPLKFAPHSPSRPLNLDVQKLLFHYLCLLPSLRRLRSQLQNLFVSRLLQYVISFSFSSPLLICAFSQNANSIGNSESSSRGTRSSPLLKTTIQHSKSPELPAVPQPSIRIGSSWTTKAISDIIRGVRSFPFSMLACTYNARVLG